MSWAYLGDDERWWFEVHATRGTACLAPARDQGAQWSPGRCLASGRRPAKAVSVDYRPRSPTFAR
jgi:hypothetical protein